LNFWTAVWISESTKVVFLKPWGFGLCGIHDRVISHDSQSLTVLGKPP
jgi:hypothetical protein